MKLVDIVVLAVVVISGIASAVAAKKKKAAAAKALGQIAVEPATSLPRVVTPQTTGVSVPAAAGKPLRARAAETRPPMRSMSAEEAASGPAVPEFVDAAYSQSGSRSNRERHWNWKQAVIARTVLSPPRAIKGWGESHD
jgi:hypothetical protein